MRILCIASEPPYPPIHGGRVDLWQRYKMMRRAGCELMLVCWSTEPIPARDMEKMGEVFDIVHVEIKKITLLSILRRLAYLHKFSPHVSSRQVSKNSATRIFGKIGNFRADLILLDEPYGWLLARGVAEKFGLPIFYRSHNVEFRFMRLQAKLASGLRSKIAYRLASFHLEKIELMIQLSAKAVFDISSDDMRYWRSRGVANNYWLPTPFDDQGLIQVPWHERKFDVLYIGNLYSPNNIEGIDWFLKKVTPLLRQSMPNIRICIAGSNPSPYLRKLFSADPSVYTIINPVSSLETLRFGKVLINPIFSGSGINVKAVEMLFFDSPIVTTTFGLRGFPSWVQEQFCVADEATTFASAIIAQLSHEEFVADGHRLRARNAFGMDSVRGTIDTMSKSVAKSI